LKILAFQALNFESPSSLSYALTEDEAILKTVYMRDLIQNKLIVDLKNKPLIEYLCRLKIMPQMSSFHALRSDTMLEFKGKIVG
jgi:hypothetical protein